MEKSRQVRRAEARKSAWAKIRKDQRLMAFPRRNRRAMMRIAAAGSNLSA